MNHVKKLDALPAFFQNRRLAWVAVLVSLMALMGAILGFMVNWLIGLVWLGLVVFALIVIFKTLQIIGEDTAHYIENLSYRVNRGEQEAIIQMPLGVILFNEQAEIDWVNPYLQSYLGEEIIVGRTLTDVSTKLADVIKRWPDEDKRVTRLTWLDRTFDVQVQPELRAVYLLDATASVQLSSDYEAHRLFVGIVSLDNYDEVTEGMSDYEIVKTLYHAVMDNTKYNYSLINRHQSQGIDVNNPSTEEREILEADPEYWLCHSWMGVANGVDVVCDGYSEAFQLLMNMAGIPCVHVCAYPEDYGEGHRWNKVQLDGVWYNVDLTWADTNGNRNAFILRSDAAFQRDGHEKYTVYSYSWYREDEMESFVKNIVSSPKDYR